MNFLFIYLNYLKKHLGKLFIFICVLSCTQVAPKKIVDYQSLTRAPNQEPLEFKIGKLTNENYFLEVEDHDYSQTKKYELEISLDGIHYHFANLDDGLNDINTGRVYASEDNQNLISYKKSRFKFQLPDKNLQYFLRLKKVFKDGAFTLYGPLNANKDTETK